MDITQYFTVIQLEKESHEQTSPGSPDSPRSSSETAVDLLDHPVDSDQPEPDRPDRPDPPDVDEDYDDLDEEPMSSETAANSDICSVAMSNLPVPVSEVHKREIIKKGPTQPSNCVFPKRKFSKPAWYNVKEA